MDNGEQDGRYVGSFAPRMYPLGADRKQQYFNFQRHYGAEVKEIKTRNGQRFCVESGGSGTSRRGYIGGDGG